MSLVAAMRSENISAICDGMALGLPEQEVRRLRSQLHEAEQKLAHKLALADAMDKPAALATSEAKAAKCRDEALAEYYQFSLLLDNHVELLCERYRFGATWRRFLRWINSARFGLR